MYFAPYIDETGLHIPTYTDIRDDMVRGAKTIFGDDIYLENDSADYQLISIFAAKTFDTLQACAVAYNSRSPVTAIGSGLDAVVKINGISRKPSTNSTCDVVITGIPYTQIFNGSVADVSGVIWNLPQSVTIPAGGTITVTATCSQEGPVAAAANELTKINTPTYGWTSVTNPSPASVGVAQETDGDLRRRQSLSVALPSQTMLEGTRAAIASIDSVNRLAVYENDTNSASVTTDNPYGLPAHSITCVVEGGEIDDIAEQILYHKGIGCYTNGDVSTTVTDSGGYSNTIRFYRPTYKDLEINVTLIPYTGYVATMATEVQEAIFEYISKLEVAADVSISVLTSIAIACNDDISHPNFGVSAVTVGDVGGTPAGTDYMVDYNEIAQVTDINNITVSV